MPLIVIYEKIPSNQLYLRGLPVIDYDNYRLNVGILIFNDRGQVLWAKRNGQRYWQFPQGGIDSGETPEKAMFRELYEEVGLTRNDVKIVSVSRCWLRYKLPKHLVRWNTRPLCIGQKQKWFLLHLDCDESRVNLKHSASCEFDSWRWVSFWYPVRHIVSFKRGVYRHMMKEFCSVVTSSREINEDSITKTKAG